MFAEVTSKEHPECKPFFKSFSSTSDKRKYLIKFETIYNQVKDKAHSLSPEEFYKYFVDQKFIIRQGQKHLTLTGTTGQWKYMFLVWMASNDDTLITKFDLKPVTSQKEQNPYHGLPFSRKQVKQVINNFNRIPQANLNDIRKQLANIPESMLPDDLCRELYTKLKSNNKQ